MFLKGILHNFGKYKPILKALYDISKDSQGNMKCKSHHTSVLLLHYRVKAMNGKRYRFLTWIVIISR